MIERGSTGARSRRTICPSVSSRSRPQIPKLTKASIASPARSAIALRIGLLLRCGCRRGAAEKEIGPEQQDSGQRQEPGFLEQGRVKAVVEMGDEAEQA